MLPGGMAYRVLVLPPADRMTPVVARRIAELAQAGVPILGPKPSGSPSLRRLSPVRFAGAADRSGGLGQGPRRDGTGSDVGRTEARTRPGLSRRQFATRLAQQGQVSFAADFLGPSPRQRCGRLFHQQSRVRSRAAEGVFRISNKQPERWDPGSGQIRPLSDWTVQAGRTHIPLQFGPAESFFIVFRRPANPPSARTPNFPSTETLAEIAGPWSLVFPPGCGTPPTLVLPSLVSLHTMEDSAVRTLQRYRHLPDHLCLSAT